MREGGRRATNCYCHLTSHSTKKQQQTTPPGHLAVIHTPAHRPSSIARWPASTRLPSSSLRLITATPLDIPARRHTGMSHACIPSLQPLLVLATSRRPAALPAEAQGDMSIGAVITTGHALPSTCHAQHKRGRQASGAKGRGQRKEGERRVNAQQRRECPRSMLSLHVVAVAELSW